MKRSNTFVLAALLCACSSESTPASDAGNDATAPDAKSGDAGADATACEGLCKVSLVAGTPGGRGTVDGTSDAARFMMVTDMVEHGGNLYLVDLGNRAVRKLELASGKVTTLAGQLGVKAEGEPKDGIGAAATFHTPAAIARVDDVLFVSDGPNLRRIALDGTVTTIKDWTGVAQSAITALRARGKKLYLNDGSAIAVYDTETGHSSIVAGNPTAWGIVDGPSATARFYDPRALVVTDDSTLYVADGCVVRKVTLPSGDVSTLAGQSTGNDCVSGVKDGTGSAARFQPMWGITSTGTQLFITERTSIFSSDTLAAGFGRVRAVDLATAEVTTLVGELPLATSLTGEQDGDGAKTRLLRPWPIAAVENTICLATATAIRSIEGGKVSTVAGPLVTDAFVEPGAVAIGAEGKYAYLVLDGRHELGRVDLASGSYETLQRFDADTFPVDAVWGMQRINGSLYLISNQALISYDLEKSEPQVLLGFPATFYSGGLATNGTSLFISGASGNEHQVWKVAPQDAAKYEVVFSSTDIVTNAGVAHHDGSLYMADGTRVVQLDLATSKTTEIKGLGNDCTGGGFGRVLSVATDGKGSLFFGDRICHNVRRYDVSSGAIASLAGSKDRAVFAAGNGSAAGINWPGYMAFDGKSGALLVSDPADNILIKLSAP